MAVAVGILAAVLAAGCCWVGGLLLADRLLSGTTILARLVGGSCLAYWLCAWLFEVLALLGWFRLPVLVLVAIVFPAAGIWSRRSQVGKRLKRIGGEARSEGRELVAELRQHRWLLAGFSLIALHVGLRLARTLATPSFGWDDFTYHLFRAGRWVQNGGFRLEPAPDAWTYYEFFPWGGDLVWAWALVWKAGDVLVPLAAIGLWAGVLLSAYAVARELDQDRPTALVVASSIALLPSQISQTSTAYVDNAVLLMVLAASLFLLVYLQRDRGPASAFAIGMACGLGLLVKMSFLPLMAVAASIVLATCRRRGGAKALLAWVAGVSVVVPNLLYNWFHRGSLFYPFEVVGFLPYNEQHSWILNKFGEGATIPELVRAARALLMNDSPFDPFLNLGFLGAVLLLLGVAGSFRLLDSVPGRWYCLWAYAGAAITVLTFFSPRNSSMFALWTLTMGRLLVPSLSPLLNLSGLSGPRIVSALLFPLLLVEYLLRGRRKWPVEMSLATLQVIGVILVAAGLWWIWRRRPYAASQGWLPLAILSALALLTIVGVRERFRWDAYRLFSERQLYDFHGVPYVGMWPLWRESDQPEGTRIAVAAGYDGEAGHNWFRWPLLGTRLQNEVVYLPVTTDGELVSYFDPEALVEAADMQAWLQRIADRQVEMIAALGPANIEHRWIRDHPDLFHIQVSMANGNFLLARVDRRALAAYLDSPPQP